MKASPAFPQTTLSSSQAHFTGTRFLRPLRLPLIRYRVHAITAQISPVPNSSGIEVLETDAFRLQCFQTLTGNSLPACLVLIQGTKFLLITEPRQANVDAVLRRIYELYSDYVMKNPFYQLEMPIRCEEFDRNLGVYAKSIP
jgi:hypothetical protein